jgi:basic amino acid/polyamine antiporter, APA family
MAKDGCSSAASAKLHPKYKTPGALADGAVVWTCILCVSGSYGQLLDYIIFAVLVFYILTIAGLFVLRRKRPDEPAALSRHRLSRAARDVYCDGRIY